VRFAGHKERRAIVEPIAPVTEPRIVPFLFSELRLSPQEQELLGRAGFVASSSYYSYLDLP
jgi:hypothetical protein